MEAAEEAPPPVRSLSPASPAASRRIERSIPSNFHRMLRMLGEEHDRCMALAARTFGAGGGGGSQEFAEKTRPSFSNGVPAERTMAPPSMIVPRRVSAMSNAPHLDHPAADPQRRSSVSTVAQPQPGPPRRSSVSTMEQLQRSKWWAMANAEGEPSEEDDTEGETSSNVKVPERQKQILFGGSSTHEIELPELVVEKDASMKSERLFTPFDFVHLHKEWLVEPEDLKMAKSFSFSHVRQPHHTGDSQLKAFSTGHTMDWTNARFDCTFVRSPGSFTQLCWDSCGFCCITFDLIWIPIYICFDPPSMPSLNLLEWIVRIFWTLDIFATCTLAYQTGEGMLEQRVNRIVARYVRSRWLLFDSLIVVADWIPALIAFHGESVEVFGLLRIGKIPRALRVLRILRLARVVRIEHIVMMMKDTLLMSSETLSIALTMLKNMLCILFLCHITACVWFYIGNEPTDDHWVHYHGLDDEGVTLREQYLWAFHWVAGQWMPTSSEVRPRNEMERQFNVIIVVGGVMTFSTFMGAITASITSLRNLAVSDLSQFFLLRRYLYENNISRSLSIRISRYTDLALEMHKKRIDHHKVQYLKLLSGPLNLELQKEIYLPHLRMHDFFDDYNRWDPAAMSHLCFVACSRSSVAKGDTLFSLGAESHKMYCAITGAFVYQRRRGLMLEKTMTRPKRRARVGPAIWCCEASLWVRWHHFGSMVAMIESEVVEVDAQKFRDVTKARDSVFTRAMDYAKDYAHALADNATYAWDVPSALLYSTTSPGLQHVTGEGLNNFFWWQREVVDAENREVGWMGQLDSDDSDREDDFAPGWSSSCSFQATDAPKEDRDSSKNADLSMRDSL